MKKENLLLKEESLDPSNWDKTRELGHRMLDDMLDYLQTVTQRPVWKKPSAFAINSMDQPLPRLGQPMDEVYEEFFTQILPFNTNNIHPRFWAWVQGGGSPTGMLADMLASGMNPNVSIGDHMPMYLELQVLEWCKELMGYPAAASGILTSGASLANITALTVARNHFHCHIRKKGLHAINGQLTVYASTETHSCVQKAVEVIGIGSEHLRKVPVDDQYRIRIDVLEEMIKADKKLGYVPFCIIGNAGTVNTGAIDDLEALNALAKKEKLWFHIDGAFGAIPRILPEFEEQLKGIALSDSISFDFHKWFYMNYEVACVLIRDKTAHRNAFVISPSYLVSHEEGLAGGPESFTNYGLELSRGFKALKVWMLLKENGLEKYQRLVRQNLQQAQWLASLVAGAEQLRLMAPVPMNIVCFRYINDALNNEQLNELNKQILMQLHVQEIAVPSFTMLNGCYVIRVAITNHRSRKNDFDVLVKEVIRLGNELSAMHGAPVHKTA